jgi:hypothetical protein
MCGASGAMSHSITPERPTAALTTRAEATMMTIWSLNPAKAWSAGTIPPAIAASSASAATAS